MISHPLMDVYSNLAHLETDYKKKLNMIKYFIIQADKATVSGNFDTHTSYRYLVDGQISEVLNDASLCIREIHLWKEAIHPDDLSEKDTICIANAAQATTEFLRGLAKALNVESALAFNEHVRSRGIYNEQDMSYAIRRHSSDRWFGSRELPRLFHCFLKELNSSFTLVERESNYIYHCRLGQWCELFLGLAGGIQVLLTNLSEELGNDGKSSEEELTNAFTSLSIR